MTTASWKRWAFPGVVALAVLPLVVSTIALALGHTYRPSADEAWIELQVRDIGHHAVLLGPYSRFGWFHPGPLLYYLLWLPYRLTGGSGASLGIAALTLNALTVVAIAFVSRRRGGLPLVARHAVPGRSAVRERGRAVHPRRVEPARHRAAVRPARVRDAGR